MPRFNKSQERFQEICNTSRSIGEHNDCTVKAVCLLARISYKKAHKMMEERGREPRKGATTDATLDALRELGFKVERVDFTHTLTVARLGDKLPKTGRFAVFTRGHVLSYINGKVADWTDGRRCTVKKIYKLTRIKK